MRKIIRSLSLMLQPSPDRPLQLSWNAAQLGLLFLPLSPFVGVLGVILAMLVTWRQLFPTIIRHPLNRGFAILAGWLLINACFAYQKGDAFVGLFNFLPFFALFAAFSTSLQTLAQLRRIAWILVIGSVPIVIIGLGQLYWGWSGDIKFLWIVIDWQLQPSGNPPGRMASVFQYANVLACYLAIAFILALGLWIEVYQRLSRQFYRRLKPAAIQAKPAYAGLKKEEPNKTVLGLIYGRFSRFLGEKLPFQSLGWRLGFLSLAVIGNAIALILTNSRNAWGIAGLACLAFALYLRWFWLIGAIASVSGGVLWSAFGPDPVRQWLRAIVPAFFWARITDQLYPDRPVATLRTTQWQFAWDMTLSRPWTGWGLRNFTNLYQTQMHEWLGHPHNLFLMLTSETGIPATLLFCGLVGWVLCRGVLLLRDRTRAIASSQDKLIFFTYLLAFFACTLFHLFDVPLFDLRVNILGWLLLAAISGLVDSFRDSSASRA